MHSMKSLLGKALVAACAVALAPAALAGPSGTVQSNNLRDADGTTGQDGTRGAGVKTPHLQNGAVTAPKLAPAAVGTDAIADGAVTAAKLGGASVTTATLQDGAVTSTKLGAASVGTATLQDGAVTAAKLADQSRPRASTGPASTPTPSTASTWTPSRRPSTSTPCRTSRASKRSAGSTATSSSSRRTARGLRRSGLRDQLHHRRVVGEPVPREDPPGEYTVSGFETKPWVDVAGSGEAVTRVIGEATLDQWGINAAFRMITGGEIRDITLVARSGYLSFLLGGYPTGTVLRNVTVVREVVDAAAQFDAVEAGNSTFDHVTLKVYPVGSGSCFTAYGLHVRGGSPMIVRDSTVTVTGCAYSIGIADHFAGAQYDIQNSTVKTEASQHAWSGYFKGYGSVVSVRGSHFTATGTAASAVARALAVGGDGSIPARIEVRRDPSSCPGCRAGPAPRSTCGSGVPRASSSRTRRWTAPSSTHSARRCAASGSTTRATRR